MLCLHTATTTLAQTSIFSAKNLCPVRKMSNKILRELFQKSVDAVRPENLIRENLRRVDRHLYVNSRSYPLHKPCYLVGFGKAVYGMALETEKLLGDHLQRAIVTVPVGITANFPRTHSKINFIEGAKNNIPDKGALDGAVEIKRLVENLSGDDLLLVLISGGGSALLPLPKPPISLEEKQQLVKDLAAKGADILELNCVRKRISVLKGGGLAELAYPATVISLILSDVVGDPLDFIASGPTVPNRDGIEDAVNIIRKYGIYEHLPSSIKMVLGRDETKSSLIFGDEYKHVQNIIIGNNRMAAEAVKQHAISLGFQSAIISTTVTGNVTKISRLYAALAREVVSVICNSSSTASKQELELFLRNLNPDLHVAESNIKAIVDLDFSKGACLIGAGETTVTVSGGGRGGRNQQLALAFSVELNKTGGAELADVSFLSGGTDGIDGPTDAAGAIGTLALVNKCRGENIKPEDYLDSNDSYGFYERFCGGEYLIKTGHTGTNVMDIHLLCIVPK